MKPFEFVTPRLLLRTATVADVEVVQQAKLETWHALQLWTAFAHHDQRSAGALASYVRASEAESPLQFVLGFRRDTAAFAVATGLVADDDRDDTYEVGYWVAANEQGFGFATEATNALIRHAFGPRRAKAITINYYDGNEKSARVVSKLGFTFLRTGLGERKRCLDGAPVDVHYFQRLNADGLPEL